MSPISKQSELRLVLYTRPDCELCDRVAVLAQQLGIVVEPCDITEDLKLLQAYGTRIPVLRDAQTGREFDYPVDPDALRRWMEEQGA